tara:strand:+ start:396 stop:620 length:225 start_codon:yes stop_codon:yes gene_type:complete
MKATLKFDLENQEDKRSHMRCVKSLDMASFIWELQHNFWRKWKHNEEFFTLDRYQEALGELMEEHSINLEDLIE